MIDNVVNVRIAQKHDTEANWNLCSDFIPYYGEIIIYDPDVQNPSPRLKVGNGATPITELPFMIEIITAADVLQICGANKEL